MQPAGLEGLRALGLRPLGHWLFLLGVLLLVPPLWVTCTQTTPSSSSIPTTPATSSANTTLGTPNASTTPGTTSDPRLREQARALMRDFPLVDGCVCACVRPKEAKLTPRLLMRPLRTFPGCPFPSVIHGCPFSLWHYSRWNCFPTRLARGGRGCPYL